MCLNANRVPIAIMVSFKFLLILLSLFAPNRCEFDVPVEPKADGSIVQIGAGKIQGSVHSLDDGDQTNQILIFQGIRFATANRFEKPKLVDKFDEDIYDATKPANSCWPFMQGFEFSKGKSLSYSEDCLFLNIYKPKIDLSLNQSPDLLPVMVWIYGGGFQTGTIFAPLYDCSPIAAFGQVIVVSLNYRLGPLGFLYDASEDAAGNLGLYDQLMGLQWIKNNIEAFGGDPQKVTIFGESAGSISVSAQILSPLAKGLFQRAILQSGSIAPAGVYSTKEDALKITRMFAEKLNCHHDEGPNKLLDCLRTKSIEEIREAGMHNLHDLFVRKAFLPVVGNEFLPLAASRFETTFNEVDLMAGLTRDDGSFFSWLLVPQLNDETKQFTQVEINQIIQNMLNNLEIPETPEISDFYTKNLTVSDLEQVRKMFNALFGDIQLNCPTMLFAKNIARKSKQKHRFYSYVFDQIAAKQFIDGPEWLGVCHASEVPYIMGSKVLKSHPQEWKLSKQMIKAWTNFAKIGQPGSIAETEWTEAVDDPNQPSTIKHVLSLATVSRMIDNPFKQSCEKLWEKILMDKIMDSSKSTIRKQEL